MIVDDSEFTARNERNFLWVTFTRSNPAADIEGIGSFIDKKHWGCTGPLVIDARIKPHHAPPLVDDPAIERKVDELAAPGGPLHGVYLSRAPAEAYSRFCRTTILPVTPCEHNRRTCAARKTK